jgi:hypothetical protein
VSFLLFQLQGHVQHVQLACAQCADLVPAVCRGSSSQGSQQLALACEAQHSSRPTQVWQNLIQPVVFSHTPTAAAAAVAACDLLGELQAALEQQHQEVSSLNSTQLP